MSKKLHETVASNQRRIEELAVAIHVWDTGSLSRNATATINELQDRLSYKLLELEEQGQRCKIANMEEVLRTLKEDKGMLE